MHGNQKTCWVANSKIQIIPQRNSVPLTELLQFSYNAVGNAWNTYHRASGPNRGREGLSDRTNTSRIDNPSYH